MRFVWYFALAFMVVSLVVTALVWAVRRICGARPQRYWRRAGIAHLLLVPLYVFVGVPLALGWFGARMAHTRGDESGYQGPRFDAEGRWLVQTRETIVAGADERHAVRFRARDGVELRAFLVAPVGAPKLPPVVLAHGLFRGALEIEPVGAMFRELGAEVLLLEMRSHGKSARAASTFGRDEALDVEAAVAFLRARAGHASERVILFGVSLGAAAVMYAAPRVERLAALVLDAPMDEALATAHRMFDLPEKPGHRRMQLVQPFRSLVIASVELWAGISLAELRPIDAVRTLPADLPVLVVGGGDDQRMPPEIVRAVFDALPMNEPTKELWIRAGSDHGGVFGDAPDEYRARLRALVVRVR